MPFPTDQDHIPRQAPVVVQFRRPPHDAMIEWAQTQIAQADLLLNQAHAILMNTAGKIRDGGKHDLDDSINTAIGYVREGQGNIQHALVQVHTFRREGYKPLDFPVLQGLPKE